jgi:uncharacterized protein
MLSVAQIRRLIADFQERWVPDFVKRELKVDLLQGKIASIYGPRRAGKTYLLYQLAESAHRAGLPRQAILYVNFEDERILPAQAADLGRLADFFATTLPDDTNGNIPLLLLDEVQNVADWPVVLRRLADSGHFRIVVTGSSSKVLGKELSSRLRGRCLTYELLPFSYRELALCKELDLQGASGHNRIMLTELLRKHLQWGGYPEVWLRADSDRLRNKLLQDYFYMTFYRDLIDRHGISNTPLLKMLLKYMAANAGNLFSVNSFFRHLRASGVKVSKDSLYRYLDHAEEALLYFSVPVYSRSIKEQTVNPRKFYCVDAGLRNSISPSGHSDLGRMLEHVVYLDLRRRGYEVCYWKGAVECDFVASRDGEPRHVIQVAYDISTPEVLAREMAGLAAASKALPSAQPVLVVGEFGLPAHQVPSQMLTAIDWLAQQ